MKYIIHHKMSLTSEFESLDSADVGELRGEAVEDLRQPRDSRPGQPLAEALPGNGGALPPPHLGKEGIGSNFVNKVQMLK